MTFGFFEGKIRKWLEVAAGQFLVGGGNLKERYDIIILFSRDSKLYLEVNLIWNTFRICQLFVFLFFCIIIYLKQFRNHLIFLLLQTSYFGCTKPLPSYWRLLLMVKFIYWYILWIVKHHILRFGRVEVSYFRVIW